MESLRRAMCPLSLAALLLLISAPGLRAQTKIKCHHEENVDTSAKIFKVFNQTALLLHQCDAPLSTSACHIVYNYKGRASLNLGCGNCSTVTYDRKHGCEECASTNCNFDQRNASIFPQFFKKEVLDEYSECQTFHGAEPSDFKSASAVRIQCIGNNIEKKCARSFYLDNKVKKLFIGCYLHCLDAIKYKKMSDGTGRDARCEICKLEGQASTTLVKDVCLGPRAEIDKGPVSNKTGSVIKHGDKPQDKNRSPLATAPVGGPPALLASATALLVALHLAAKH